MKKILFCILFFAGCKSPSEFMTPNEVEKEKVTLVFRDRHQERGLATILFENYYSPHLSYGRNIQFIPEGKDSSVNVDINLISGFWHDSVYYALKKVDIHLNGEYRLLFVKRLTAENSKIQLYELFESGRGNGSGEAGYSYYISYPSCGPLDAVNTRSSTLMPSFDRKMSEIVSDCPELAQKILAKDHGYFIPFTSFNTKKDPEVLMRIIGEYNQCN